MFSKQTETALGAMSVLASRWSGGGGLLSAARIAELIGQPRPIVAKILTVLSGADLACSTPGPNGGYALSRPPGEIRLCDVATLFERLDHPQTCPFGGEGCRGGEPCPMHEAISGLVRRRSDMLQQTTLALFRDWHRPSDRAAHGAEAMPRAGAEAREAAGVAAREAAGGATDGATGDAASAAQRVPSDSAAGTRGGRMQRPNTETWIAESVIRD